MARPPLPIGLMRAVARAVAAEISVYYPDRPARPGPVQLVPVREEFGPMSTKIDVYEATLPPLAEPNDVATRSLYLVIDGQEQAPIVKAPGDGPFEITVPQGSVFKVRLVDSDGVNPSEPWESAEMTAADTFGPATPGEVALRPLREEFVDESTTPAPEPTPTPEPTPEPAPEG